MTYVCQNCHKLNIALAVQQGKCSALEEQFKLVVQAFGQAGGSRQAHGRADYWPAQIAGAKNLPDLSGAVSGMLADSGQALKDKETWLNAVARFQESDPELAAWLAFAVWRAKILESVKDAPAEHPEQSTPEQPPEYADTEDWAVKRIEELRKAGENAVYTLKPVEGRPGVQEAVIIREDGTEEKPPEKLRP